MEAARLLRDGVWQAEVARRLGVRRQSVGTWAEKIRRGGVWALKARRLGRPRKLHAEQLKRAEKQLERGPQVIARPGRGGCCAGWGGDGGAAVGDGGGRAEARGSEKWGTSRLSLGFVLVSSLWFRPLVSSLWFRPLVSLTSQNQRR